MLEAVPVLNVVEFRKRFPQLKGRVVLQDFPPMVTHAVKLRDLDALEIEAYIYDFFQPQPAKGVGVYCLRSILHGMRDTDCKKILGHLQDAMEKEYSRILIHEEPLKDRGCRKYLDLQMITSLSSPERMMKA